MDVTRTRRRQRSTPYALEDPTSWTKARLKAALASRGVTFRSNASKAELLSLYNNGTRLPADDTQDLSGVDNSDEMAPRDSTTGYSDGTDAVLHETVRNLTETVVTLNERFNRFANANEISTTLNRTAPSPAQATCSSDFHVRDPVRNTQHTLQTALAEMHNPGTVSAGTLGGMSGRPVVSEQTCSFTKHAYGYSLESLPFIETISPKLRQKIIEGKYVNLATLLIPYYNGPEQKEANTSCCKSDKVDPRLHKMLTLPEFIQAFGIYKNIMCEAFPQRRPELDLYERDIVDMASRYGGHGFYEYHKQFSSTAAAHLEYHNRPVDWSIRNNSLFCNIFANQKPNSCYLCNSTAHNTAFCPLQMNDRDATYSFYGQRMRGNSDFLGRTIHNVTGEICNHFNTDMGCSRGSFCRFVHVCISCKRNHPKTKCPESKNGIAFNNNQKRTKKGQSQTSAGASA